MDMDIALVKRPSAAVEAALASRDLDLGARKKANHEYICGSSAITDPAVLAIDEQIEAANAGGTTFVASRDLDLDGGSPAITDPAILEFDEKVVEGPLRKIVTCAEKIRGKVLEATKILEESFLVQKELMIKAKQIQKPDEAGVEEFLKPLIEVMAKANILTEGAFDYLDHLECTERSLVALDWMAFLGVDRVQKGMFLPTKHVEECWLQLAEYHYSEVLDEYRNKDRDHVEWANALKELYVPNLRDYVKKNYPLGLAWGPP